MASNQLLASDNFASGSLAAGWSAWPNLSECAITGAAPYYAEPAGTVTSYGQLWTGLTWGKDQVSEATIETLNSTGSNALSLGVRYTAGNSGYQATIFHSSVAATLTVYAIAAGVPTQLGSTVTGLTISAGDVWSLSAMGAVIAVYQNGTRVFYIGDATFTSGGAPGFFLSATTAAVDCQVASWRGYSGVQQDGIWQKQGVILPATANQVANAGNFGTGVTGLQGVFYDGSPIILAGPKVYKGWFTDGYTNGVNYAESSDGKIWTPYASNPVLANYTNGAIVKYSGTYYHWGQKAAQVADGVPYFSTSTDGVTWSAPTVTTGFTATSGVYFNLAIADVIGGVFYALYSGLNGSNSAPNTYLATSSDGLAWTIQNSGNPVLTNVFCEGAPVKVGSTYYMWGTANQPGQGNSTASAFDPFDTVLYSSSDLVHWTFVHHSIHRNGLWESLNSTEAGAYATSVLFMPTLNRVGMYYVASPGDSTGPQVYQGGLALAPPNSTLAQIVAANEDATQQTVVDNFTSGAGDLDANWTTQSGASKLQIVAGPYVEATNTAGTRCVMLFTGATFGINQYAEITVKTLTPATNQFLYPLVLGDPNSHSYYYAQLNKVIGSISSALQFIIGKSVNNVGTILSNPVATPNNLTLQVGDVIRLAATQGTDGSIILSVYQNGFLILQAQDYAASLTTGFPGIQMNTITAEADNQISGFAAGNTNVIPTYPSLGGQTGLQLSMDASLRNSGLRH